MSSTLDWTIRPADATDQEQIVSLAMAVHGSTHAEAEAWLTKNRATERGWYVAVEDHQVIGYVTILLPRDTFLAHMRSRNAGASNIVEVARLMVHPDHRRRNVGTELTRTAGALAWQSHMEPFALVLEGNEPSRAMFEAAGYVLWGRYNGLDGVNLIYCPPAPTTVAPQVPA